MSEFDKWRWSTIYGWLRITSPQVGVEYWEDPGPYVADLLDEIEELRRLR